MSILLVAKEGIVHWLQAVHIGGILVGPVRKEELDDLDISFICCPVETGASLRVSLMHDGRFLEKQGLYGSDVPLLHELDDSRKLLAIPVIGITLWDAEDGPTTDFGLLAANCSLHLG